MTKQLEHYSFKKAKQKNTIILLCDQLQSPANIGAIFRLADAFAVQEIVFTQEIDLDSNRLKRTARDTYKSVPHRVIADGVSEIIRFHESGYTSIALELTDNSIPLYQLTGTEQSKYVLIVGNEKAGVSNAILTHVGLSAYIPMHGTNSSMNVAQAVAIGLYHLSQM